MLINDYYIVLRFSGGEAELEDNDPSHYLYITEGTVVAQDEADQTEDVGRVRLFYIDVERGERRGFGRRYFDYTQETCENYSDTGGGVSGIDEIIIDRLGLDAIYLQAKRWQGSVGRRDNREFVGALQGQRARKASSLRRQPSRRCIRICFTHRHKSRFDERNGACAAHDSLRYRRLATSYLIKHIGIHFLEEAQGLVSPKSRL
ncbi:restriction endonuclease [Massilia sp.]|uniref:restriction endonuclease n=1 Tax=Massilia sp. TaxID=1882437 RepID=UPI0028A02A17|nr:restriction endonuclease [Massilia sp.]